MLKSVLDNLPALPQRQDSLQEQLSDLRVIANRLGMYDAADAIAQIHGNVGIVIYGCHLDLEDGQEPDDCVIDSGRHSDCTYAKPGMRREQCPYWRVKTPKS